MRTIHALEEHGRSGRVCWERQAPAMQQHGLECWNGTGGAVWLTACSGRSPCRMP